jgi:hypothetical protein
MEQVMRLGAVILPLHFCVAELLHTECGRCCAHLCFVYELLHCRVVVRHSQAGCAVDLQQPRVVVGVHKVVQPQQLQAPDSKA